MIVKIHSYGIKGIEAVDVIIEVSVAVGLAKFEIIGLPDTAIKESKERIFKAIIENGYKVPPGNITINLAPAKIKKRGPIYDLPIALGILMASKQILVDQDIEKFIIAGELSLNGDVREVEGVFISLLQSLMEKKKCSYLLPTKNLINMFSLIDDKASPEDKPNDKPNHCLSEMLYPVNTFTDAIDVLEQGKNSVSINPECLKHLKTREKENSDFEMDKDFRQVLGNRIAKIALQLSVINRLNVLLIGPPGCGKTMLMERVPTILPALEKDDAYLVTRIHNAKKSSNNTFMKYPPFREVHNTIHSASLIGGGRSPEPGEITLAHKGFLFMDEFSEFDKAALQSLRTPLERKEININRVEDQVTFPSDFVLLASSNPCPCGYFGDDLKMCECNPAMMSRFYSKLSGPILDRFDIILFINKLDQKEMKTDSELDSKQMRLNVEKAIQNKSQIENPFYKKDYDEIFDENPLLKELLFKAKASNFLSLRKTSSIFRLIYTLMLYYSEPKITKDIIMDAIEFSRDKVRF